MELFLHRFGGSRFRESKDRGKMPHTTIWRATWLQFCSGRGRKRSVQNGKSFAADWKIIRLEIEKSFGAEKTRAK